MQKFEFFIVFAHTDDNGRETTSNGTFEIEGGIESIDDVRFIESTLSEEVPASSVRLMSWRPFLPGAVECRGLATVMESVTETTTVEHVEVQDQPAWGSRY